jgi:tryptophan synthase beta chain
VILVNLSGRGDKDVDTAAKWFGMIGEGQSAEDADGTAIAQGPPASEPSPGTSFADPGAQTEGIQL